MTLSKHLYASCMGPCGDWSVKVNALQVRSMSHNWLHPGGLGVCCPDLASGQNISGGLNGQRSAGWHEELGASGVTHGSAASIGFPTATCAQRAGGPWEAQAGD